MQEITNDNSVSYVNKDDHSHRYQTPPISNTRKRKKLPEKNRKFMKKIIGEWLRIVKRLKNWQF